MKRLDKVPARHLVAIGRTALSLQLVESGIYNTRNGLVEGAHGMPWGLMTVTIN